MKENSKTPIFAEALEKLNEGQREAVETIEGPVMVIAGPGTGKTQILTLRIANILQKTDTRPEQILALTFTDSGVRAMRNRLVSFIGPEAYHVPIHTFHSFAGELIKRYPDAYEHIVGGQPASDLEKISIIEELLEEGTYKRLRPHGDRAYYVKPILDAIATLKKENISPETFANYINDKSASLLSIEKIHVKGAHKGKVRGEYLEAEKALEKNQELLYLYQRYIAMLREMKLYDFEDMILDTIRALENNQEMLFDVQEQYQYLLADEHQDVNQSQNRLIELISSYHENPNVFVVGDEKQAIYRFQGASLDNFLYFSDIYKNAKIIALTDNYRSDQKILNVAHDSIKTDDPTLKDLRVPLLAKQQFSTQLFKHCFSHVAIEDAWVVEEVKRQAESGVEWGEIAVIVRTNREVELFSSLLRKEKIAVSPSADSDILHHPITHNIINLLRFATDPTEEAALAELLHASYWKIPAQDLVKVLSARSYANGLIQIIGSEEKLQEIGVGAPELFINLLTIMKEAKARELTETPAQVAEFILNASGFIAQVLNQDSLEAVRIVRRLYDEIESMFIKNEAQDLKTVLERFALSEKYKLSLTAPFIQTTNNAVKVLTAHKAKGLEFEVVMIPHLTDNLWGVSQRANLFKLPVTKHEVDNKVLLEDDERRLFYVAITRAKRVLHCSMSTINTEGRELTPSRFVAALNKELLPEASTSEFEANFEPLEGLKREIPSQLSAEFLKNALIERGWSATSFNNYQKNPWEYVYRNALRIPTVQTPELKFGSSVHEVLEKITRYIKENDQVPSETEISQWLDKVLGSRAISVQEFTRQHRRAFEAIVSYLPQLEQSLSSANTIRTEYSLQATLETGIDDFPEVLLTGNLDRVDFDAEGNITKVVDYKTGKAKTRGEIEGKTKTSNGAYKRQLTFYALLLSLQPDPKMHSRSSMLSFVEPDKKGIIHEEEYTITDSEIEELRMQIINATKELISGESLQVICDPEECNFCHLAERLTV